MMTNPEDQSGEQLSQLFRQYRDSCEEPTPSAAFMPEVWARIESRRSFAMIFSHGARTYAAAAGLVCVLLLVLTLVRAPHATLPAPTYVDALAADHTAESMYYAEAVRNSPDYDVSIVGPDGRR